ncbi:Cytochrome P450 monooxygenase ATR2 [Paramyrothecium foliicola]|nr:Cytochrome P450 monooxygenase ATR2 [Paramyrothecium foliicola]
MAQPMDPILLELSPRLLMMALGSCIFGIIIAARAYFAPNPLAAIPVVGKGTSSSQEKQSSSNSPWDFYQEGYRMIKAGAKYFRIATTASTETVVLSPVFLDELRKLPDDVLSFTEATAEITQSSYTKFIPEVPGFVHTINTALTPALVRLSPCIAQEVHESAALELPQTREWKEVKINDNLLRIIAMVSGRIFVGPELCRSEQYIEMAVNYVTQVMVAAHTIVTIPRLVRPVVAPFLPAVKRLHNRVAESTAIFGKLISARQQGAKDPKVTKADDLLQWLIDGQKTGGKIDVDHIAQAQLSAIFASVHTSTLVATNALFTLAAMPELIPILKEDVEKAVKGSNGQFNSSCLQSMEKVDSFLKEILRFHTLSASVLNRKVIKPFKLSNGQQIPAGVYVQIPAGAMAYDDELFPNAKTFDALRFFRLQQVRDKGTSHSETVKTDPNTQLVGVSRANLFWGYGRHVCPGRFFAANEIKLIMAEILLHYEVKNPPGVTGRHKDIWFGLHSVPDPEKTIMMRRRGD